MVYLFFYLYLLYLYLFRYNTSSLYLLGCISSVFPSSVSLWLYLICFQFEFISLVVSLLYLHNISINVSPLYLYCCISSISLWFYLPCVFSISLWFWLLFISLNSIIVSPLYLLYISSYLYYCISPVYPLYLYYCISSIPLWLYPSVSLWLYLLKISMTRRQILHFYWIHVVWFQSNQYQSLIYA